MSLVDLLSDAIWIQEDLLLKKKKGGLLGYVGIYEEGKIWRKKRRKLAMQLDRILEPHLQNPLFGSCGKVGKRQE